MFHAVPGQQKAASYGEKLLKLPVKCADGWDSSSTKLLGVCTDVWLIFLTYQDEGEALKPVEQAEQHFISL